MKLGLGPLFPGAPGASLEEIVQAAELAEAYGFDSAWFTEAEWGAEGFGAPAAVAAAVAARTSTVRLGVCAAVTRGHPVHSAEEAAVLDVLSNGRAVICPIPASAARAEPAGRYGEIVEILLRTWSGEPFHHEGPFFRIPALLASNTGATGSTHVAITPPPVQTPLPVWLPGWIEETARLAAALGLTVLGAPFSTLDELVACYERSRATPSTPAPRVVPVIRELHVAPTTRAALGAAEQALARRYEQYRRQGLVTGSPDSFDALARDRFIVGDPERCLREIERYRQALGVNYLVCRPALPSLERRAVAELLELVARTLMPHLRMFRYPGVADRPC